MEASPEEGLVAWVEYLRDLGVFDLYTQSSGSVTLAPEALERLRTPKPRAAPAASPEPASSQSQKQGVPRVSARDRVALGRSANTSAARPADVVSPVSAPRPQPPEAAVSYFNTEGDRQPALPPDLAAPMPKPNPLEDLFAPPAPLAPAAKADALTLLQGEIGDCTRCPLAYAGRHTIVFGEGDPNADLMFVGEGPGADEDASGQPFVGKAGQLLNNMIGAMGLAREQVFIANVVKCRPPANRAPEFVEATTCSQFLLRQIDIVRPKVIVALGSTAATYLLGVRQTLGSLRGVWHRSRESKVVVTFHPAYLLRDPRQKAEAWKDLQRVMAELGLEPAKAAPKS